ncbi:MAG TPA: polysaccharide deacetylase family protein [Verrucomicrobiae bacterium]
MRPDRFITLNLIRPLRRLTPRASRLASLPLLMYHSISDDPESGVGPYFRVSTSPGRFREQMQWLKDRGCRGVTLSDGLAWLNDSSPSPPRGEGRGEVSLSPLRPSLPQIGNRKSEIGNIKPVVLTFDDGFRDFYTAAWPILREFGFTATMYLPTSFIGDTRRCFTPSPRRGAVPSLAGAGEGGSAGAEPDAGCGGRTNLGGRSEVPPSTLNPQPSTGDNRECLTWAEVLELHRAGMEFGSHTVNHPKLVELPWARVESEIRDAKAEIENRLGVPCPKFAYPYAFPQANRDFVVRFKDLLKSNGHDACVTTQIGRHHLGDDGLQIKRLPVNQDDDLPLLAAKLDGDYDWLAPLQCSVKGIRAVIAPKPKPVHALPGRERISAAD